MGSLSDYSENKLVDHICGTAYSPVATVYLGLSEANPGDDGAGLVEGDYTGYARVAITFGAAASRRVTQSALVTFGACTAGSNDFTHWFVADNGTLGGGNILASGALDATKSVVVGNTPSVASGEVYVEISAGGFSDYAAEGLLDLMFRNQAFSVTNTYVGFTTTVCSDSAAGTEVSGGSYAREIINEYTGGTPEWTAASAGAVSNNGDVTFTDPTGDWGTVVAVGYWDAATVGNFLMYDNAVTDQAITSGDTVKIPSGSATVSLS